MPERREEVLAIWDKAVAGVDVSPDTHRILVSTYKRRIQLSLGAIDIFWIVGFSSSSALICYVPYVKIATATDQTIEDLIRSDPDRCQFESEHRDVIHIAQAMISGDGTTSLPWPPEIAQPTDDRSALPSDFDRVVYDVTILALAFVMLHELRHAMFAWSNWNNRRDDKLLLNLDSDGLRNADPDSINYKTFDAFGRRILKRISRVILA